MGSVVVVVVVVNIYCLKIIIFRQIILSRVTLGKPFIQFTAVKMAHAPPGHHSVIGKPNAGGLSYPEYVVYRGEQVSIIRF